MKLHNKLLAVFAQDYLKGWHGRGLVGKVLLSQKGIANALAELEDEGLLVSVTQGNMRTFFLNRENPEVVDHLIIAEIRRKLDFLSLHANIATWPEDNRIVGMFGSYARRTERKDSDVDIFIIGEKRKEDAAENPFIKSISIKYFSPSLWKRLLEEKNPLAAGIVHNHIILFGQEAFVRMAWKHHYGFPANLFSKASSGRKARSVDGNILSQHGSGIPG